MTGPTFTMGKVRQLPVSKIYLLEPDPPEEKTMGCCSLHWMPCSGVSCGDYLDDHGGGIMIHSHRNCYWHNGRSEKYRPNVEQLRERLRK